jgi:phospholipase/carboxylesterase
LMSDSSRLGFVHKYHVPSMEEKNEGNGVTLLVLHGTGGDENDLIPLGRRLLPGANILSPRGRVLEDGAPRFFRRLSEGVFDMNDLANRTDELAEFVTRAAEKYRFDPGRVIAVGYSNGANIAASVLLTHPGLLTGAVLLRPLIPFEVQTAPDLSGTKVLIEAGTEDALIPRELVERLARTLEKGKAEVTLHWRQGGGHSLSEEDVETAERWIAVHFGNASVRKNRKRNRKNDPD